jgi:hypothetical protein
MNGWNRGITIPARPFLPMKPSDLTGTQRGHIKMLIEQGIWEGTVPHMRGVIPRRGRI